MITSDSNILDTKNYKIESPVLINNIIDIRPVSNPKLSFFVTDYGGEGGIGKVGFQSIESKDNKLQKWNTGKTHLKKAVGPDDNTIYDLIFTQDNNAKDSKDI